MNGIRVALRASDPLSEAGLALMLENSPEVTLLSSAPTTAGAQVLVVACRKLTADIAVMLRSSATTSGIPVVLVIDELAENELLTAVECRVVAILPRPSATAERLAHSVRAAANGGGVLPPHLVGELLKHVERLQRDVLAPNGLAASGLTPREVDVLRLMAEGLDTVEIAGELKYSDRTVKKVIAGLFSRLNLRNRSHAVAYALRAGMI